MGGLLAGMGALATMAGTAWSMDAPEISDKKRKSCHGVGGIARPTAKVGGPLDGVRTRRDEAWSAYFGEPESEIENAEMPTMKPTDEEWNVLVRHMLSLK